jgi:ABC-type sulfate transport system permease component
MQLMLYMLVTFFHLLYLLTNASDTLGLECIHVLHLKRIACTIKCSLQVSTFLHIYSISTALNRNMDVG